MSGKGSQTRATKAMKEELLKWICMSHATNASLDRLSLRRKALDLVRFFGLTGFKCSEAWLTVFLKRHGFSPSLTDCSGPKFDDYRIWINLIRPILMQYRYKDQFHVDELMMYTEFNPSNTNNYEITESIQKATQLEYDAPTMQRVILIIACNASGTEKFRPLICAPYSIKNNEHQDYIYYNDVNTKISDELFGDWLSSINREMASNNRRIIMILSRKRIGTLRYVELTHVTPLFIPNEFPTQLRPFRRDVFHYIKMIYRTKHVERLCQSNSQTIWQPEEIVETLIHAWRQVPRELIVVNFQRTKFREDDCFLNIECDSWNNLKTGVSFKRYVTFDDDLSDVCEFGLDDLKFLVSVNKHKYNLRNANSQEICELNDTEEDQSESSRELEGSLKRPSDDSIDMSSDLQDQSQEKETPTQSPMENGIEVCDQFLSHRDQDGKFDEKKVERSEEKIENLLDYVMDDIKSSPIRNASTPINKDYDKDLMNRVYPSPERTSGLTTHLSLISHVHCFEKVSKSLENRLIDLKRNTSKSSDDPLPRRQLENLFDDSSIPSTSKKGLEESDMLQKIHERLFDDHIIHDKIELNNLEIISQMNNKSDNDENNCEMLKHILTNKNNNDQENVDDVEEPTSKRQRMETNWAKCYEKHLVFGPDILNQCDGLSDETEHSGLTDVIQSQMETTGSTYQQ